MSEQFQDALACLAGDTITNLDLGGITCGNHGAERLAVALEVNTTLATLDLGGNTIGDHGAGCLAVAPLSLRKFSFPAEGG